jgi:hypothetical protein
MASAQSLGTLTIDLGLKTAQLQSDAGKAARITEQTMDKISKSAAATGQAIGIALAAGFGIVEESVRRSLDQMDEFSKAAQKVGVSTEEFSKLAYAAKLSDVSVDDLTTTLAKLSKNQVEAAKGTAAQEQAFSSLGIAIKNADGSLRAPGAVLADLADVFQALPDGAGKTAIAIGLLGKSGANAIPLLNGGAASLRELGDEAERFGVVIDGPTGRAAEEFNDNLTRLSTQAEGFATQLTANLLPDLLALEGRLMGVSDQTDAVHNVADAVRAIGDSAKLAVDGVQALTNQFLAFYNVAKAGAELTGPGFFKNLVTGQLGDKFKEVRAGLDSAKAGLDDVNKSAKQTLDTFGQGSGKTAAGIADLFEASIPKAQAKSPVSETDALKRQQAFIDASKNAEKATKAKSEAEKAARKAQAEQEALQKRIAAGTQDMTNAIAQSTEGLLKTGIPAIDQYNEEILKLTESAAKYTKDGLPASQVDAFTKKMSELAAATRDATLAQAQAGAHSETLDLAAQAQDANSAAAGIVGLAAANRDYEKSLEALDKQFEGLSITPEDYKSQLDSLDVLHKKTIADLQKTTDESGAFVKKAAEGIQSSIYDALTGEGLKGGIKGFLGGIADMLQKAAAQIVAANLAKQLFGDFDKTGKVGGASGGLLGGLFGAMGSGGTASASEAAAIRNSEAAVTGDGASWLDSLIGFFGSSARANGGPVMAGQGYLVGERGPEFFQPSSSGTIVPNGATRQMSGGNRSVTTIINVQPSTTRRTADQIAQANARAQRVASSRNG